MGNSLAVQRLGLRALTVEGPGSILGQGTKIPQATWCSQKKYNNNIYQKNKRNIVAMNQE